MMKLEPSTVVSHVGSTTVGFLSSIPHEVLSCYPLLSAFVALVLGAFFLFDWILRRSEGPLAYEEGRRKARQPYQKKASFYENFGVTSIEEYIVSSRGTELFTKQWLPTDGRFRALVFYCHGYGDTCTYCFEDVAMTLAMAHYAVVSMDYEGHGLSSGLHAYIPNFDNLVDNVVEFTSFLRGRPEFFHLPFFLYGESMGGAVALKTHFRQPTSWSGALLVAPMCKISDEMMPPPLVLAVLKLLARFFPRWKLVPTSDIAVKGFRDPAKRNKVMANPVSFIGKPRLGTALQLLTTTEEIGRNLSQVTLPLFILHGGADVVTDPALSKALFEKSKSVDKQFLLYEGAWHGLTAGEPDDVMFRVLDDIIGWLDKRSLPLPPSPPNMTTWIGPRKSQWENFEKWESTPLCNSDENLSSVTEQYAQ